MQSGCHVRNCAEEDEKQRIVRLLGQSRSSYFGMDFPESDEMANFVI
jgi:hypothetical protein